MHPRGFVAVSPRLHAMGTVKVTPGKHITKAAELCEHACRLLRRKERLENSRHRMQPFVLTKAATDSTEPLHFQLPPITYLRAMLLSWGCTTSWSE